MREAQEFYSENVEKMAESYNDDKLPEEFLQMRKRFSEMVEDGKILDAGCGTGRDTEFFNEEGLKAVGIDIAEGMIEFAKENKKGEFKIMNLKNTEFADDYFNGVWCSASIFFMNEEQMKRSLDELSRVLKGQGILYISFKTGDGKYVKKRWGEKVEEYHISVEEAKKMLENAGFDIVDFIESKSNTDNEFVNFFCKLTN